MSSRARPASIATVIIVTGCASPLGSPRETGHSTPASTTNGATWSRASTLRSTAETLDLNRSIGKLQLRDVELIVFAASTPEASLQFALLDRQGNLLRNLGSEAELHTWFPELHQAYKSAMARGAPLLDARIDPSWLRLQRDAERNDRPLPGVAP